MWEDTPFEKAMKAALKKNGQEGDILAGRYTAAKRTLAEQVYEEIKGTSRTLSDHGPRHIQNVLGNIGFLLGEEVKQFGAHDLYCLGMVALFHDVGNIYGRKHHNEKIKDIYIHACGNDDKQEMRMVIMAARAHTGDASDGTKDTLKDLDETYFYRSGRVRLREIAAVLRLADELAEGPQRTSKFVLQTMGYDENSDIYHRYASSVTVNIDRPGNRLALSYDIQVCGSEALEEKHLNATKELLQFAYSRMVKLDQERKYCKFYCKSLSVFTQTSAKFLFWTGNQEHECDLPAIVIDDKVVPGDGSKSVVEINPQYEVEKVVAKLVEKVNAPKGGSADEHGK